MPSLPESETSVIIESPGAEKNKGPIWDIVLKPIVLPAVTNGKLKVLELAAGSGVHTQHFLSSILDDDKNIDIEWHPSDPDPASRASLNARAKLAGMEKYILPANGWVVGVEGGTACSDGARDTDGKTVSSTSSTVHDGADNDVVSGMEKYSGYFDLVLCINMIHIAPWEATVGLMECAAKFLRKGGMLVLYGAYKIGGTSVESNLKFDESLRSRNPAWGVRNLEDVVEAAEKEGLESVQNVAMPANNMSLLFRKS